MEPKIIPTVGRVVYYKTRGSADGVYPPRDVAAIITNIQVDECVNLVTFHDEGLRFEIGVLRGQEPGQWDWMPFQKASASNSQSAEPRPTSGITLNTTPETPQTV